MSSGRTPSLCRALMLFATVFAAGCGAFESPVPAGDGTPTPTPTDDVLIQTLECVIAPAAGGLPQPVPAEDGSFLVTPRRGTALYARFVVQDVPPDVAFRWWVDPKGGVLPPGVSLDEQMGVISGIATKSGDFAVTLRADSVGVYGRTRYAARPYLVPIRVAPACMSDDECALAGFDGVPFQCMDDGGKAGGICTLPAKDPGCPTTTERFQVWLQEQSDLVKPGTSLEVAGTVTEHVECTTTAFSLESGGEDGWCVEIDLDRPAGGTGSTLASLWLTYRLPRNYPAPITVGARYRFVYGRGSEQADDHRSDGSLLVFEEAEDPAAAPRLILLGYSGIRAPHDLLQECANYGTCPRLVHSDFVRSVCPADSGMCGDRTRAMLIAGLPGGRTEWMATGGAPIALDTGDGDDAVPYALHLALSDMASESCADREDDYRLSYFVLPADACLLGRAAADHPSLEAPALLWVEREEGFSPAGREVRFEWEIVAQPFANALFGPVLGDRSGEDVRSLQAYVPGLYRIRATAVDDAGTPACGSHDTAAFAIHPAPAAYIELSHDTPGDLELRVAPADTPWSVLAGAAPDEGGVVAGPANVAPKWGWSWAEEPFFQARADDLLEGAGVQTFGTPDGLRGRYRVGVRYRGSNGLSLPATPDDGGAPALARVRVILNRNVDEGQVLEIDTLLEPCLFREVGVLDLDGLQPTFDASPHQPRAVCGEEPDVTDPFEPGASLPEGARREAREAEFELAPDADVGSDDRAR